MSCARPVSLVNGRLQAAVADREVQSKVDRKVQSRRDRKVQGKCDQIVMVRGHRAMASAAMTAAVQLNLPVSAKPVVIEPLRSKPVGRAPIIS